MSKEMLINVSEGEECRIAVLEEGRLCELYMERASATSHVGNIYKGKVTNVEASIQAAFIDFGLGRNGFLHISDLLPTYFGRRGGGDDYQESVGKKLGRRDRPPIQRCLRRGDEIMVQIIKEGIGTKGPTLSSYLSIPGRILVMMPGMENFGVSRKIEDDQERRRLRKILDKLDPIEGVGFIVRTAGMGKSEEDIEKDLKYLTGIWEDIQENAKNRAPVELYTEGDLVTRTVRDAFGSDIDRIVVDSKDVAKRVKDFVKVAGGGRAKTKVELHRDSTPLFHEYGIEEEIEKIHSRTVPLPSGGSLVIDSTEAVVAIDVNSGKSREHSDAETTAFKTDMEAADEIPRQLKLRDLGGVIICDFIDLRFERHRRQLEQRLFENFKKDKAKTRVLRMSEFGIIEITRQRMRPSLKRSIYSDCPSCRGHGLVKTPESMSLDVMRKLMLAVDDDRVVRVEVAVSAAVAFHLTNKKRNTIAALEEDYDKTILIRQDAGVALDEVKFELFDEKEGKVHIPVLGTMGGSGSGSGESGGSRGRGRDRGRDRKRIEPVRANLEMEPEEDEDDGFDTDRGPSANRGRPEREGGREGGRDGGRDGSREGSREGRRDGGRDRDGGRGREGGREGGRDRDRDRDRGRGREGGRGDHARGEEGHAHRDREFDHVKPVGVEQARAGAGHRGPQVVQPVELDDEYEGGGAGGEDFGHEGPEGELAGDGHGDHEGEGGEGQPREVRYDENGNPIAETGRRRRRRRRGGRGRRRNRQLDENGQPIESNGDEPLEAGAEGSDGDDFEQDDESPAESMEAAIEGVGSVPAEFAESARAVIGEEILGADEDDDEVRVDTERLDVEEDENTTVGAAPRAIGEESEGPAVLGEDDDFPEDVIKPAKVPLSMENERDVAEEGTDAAAEEAEEVPAPRRGRGAGRGEGRGSRGRGGRRSARSDADAEMPAAPVEPVLGGASEEDDERSSLEREEISPAGEADVSASGGEVEARSDEGTGRGRGRGGRGRGRGGRGRGRGEPAAEGEVSEVADTSEAVSESSGSEFGEPSGVSDEEPGSRGGRGDGRRGSRGSRSESRTEASGEIKDPRDEIEYDDRVRGSNRGESRSSSSEKRVPPARRENVPPEQRGVTPSAKIPPTPVTKPMAPNLTPAAPTRVTPVRRGPTPVNEPPATMAVRRGPTPVNEPPAAMSIKKPVTSEHIGNDEPVEPQPLKRPKSASDLDAVPEDFDEGR